MDGVHDLGGLDGFGPVEYEEAEPLFAEDWERRAFRLMLGLIGALSIPGGRFPPFDRTHGARALPVPRRTTSTGLTGAATMAVEAGAVSPTSSSIVPAEGFRCRGPTGACFPDDLTPRAEPRTPSATRCASAIGIHRGIPGHRDMSRASVATIVRYDGTFSTSPTSKRTVADS